MSAAAVQPPTKCGEVFRNEHGKYEYFCSVCPMRTPEANQLELHVSVHFQVEFVSSAIIKKEVDEIKPNESDDDNGTNLHHHRHSSDDTEQVDIKGKEDLKTVDDESEKVSAAADDDVDEVPGRGTSPPNIFTCEPNNPYCRSCVFCDKVYTLPSSLASHLRRVHHYVNAPKSMSPTIRMDCDMCGASFTGPYARGLCTYHIREHVAVKRGRRLEPQACPFCSKHIRSRRAFKDHVLTHTNERPYRCDLCDLGFNAESTMKTHRAKHSNETKFICAECGVGFAAKQMLHGHMFSKHKQKTYTCPECDPPKLFNGYSSFKYHKKSMHCKERFKCDLCEKTFKIKTCMQLHRQVHAAERAYACRYCGKTFSQNQGKRAHERRMHEEVLV